jgi:hypothetical protein
MINYSENISLYSYLISYPLILMDETNIKLKIIDVTKLNISKELFKLRLDYAKQFISSLFYKNYRIFDIKELYDLYMKYEKEYIFAIKIKRIFEKYYEDEDLSKCINKFISFLFNDDDELNILSESLIENLFDNKNNNKNIKIANELINLFNNHTKIRYSIMNIETLFFNEVMYYISFLLGSEERREFEEIKNFLYNNYSEIML